MESKKETRILAIFLVVMLLMVGAFVLVVGSSPQKDTAKPHTHLLVGGTQSPTTLTSPSGKHHVVVTHKGKHHKVASPPVATVDTHVSHSTCLTSVHTGTISIQLMAYHTADDDPTSTTDPPTTTTDPPTTTTDPPTTTSTTQPPPVITLPTITLPPIFRPPVTTTTKPAPVGHTPTLRPVPVTTTTVDHPVAHHRAGGIPSSPTSTPPPAIRRACA